PISFQCYPTHLDLHSFPTRRSSDLNLTVAETHRMFAGYYEQPRNVDEVITLVGLDEKRDARVKTLSGGQKRRLDLVARLFVVAGDRKSTRLNSSHVSISYAVFCLKK